MALQRIGIVGLGRMGGNMARLSLDKGYQMAGFDVGGIPDDLVDQGMLPAESLEALVALMIQPRVVMLSVPAGPIVDSVADQLVPHLQEDDIILDAGNSYWGDSRRRAERYADRGIHFLDLGTSGGVEGARTAPCFMIGGPRAAVEKVEGYLTDLAAPGGYVHAGGPGAGHFTKLVHNGIEFGMLQAIGEGMDLLEHFPEQLDVAGTLGCWQNGSVIRSWLIDLMARAYVADPGMQRPSGHVEDTGEVNWLIGDALNMDVAVPVIAQSVMQLIASRDRRNAAARAVTLMRHEFGGHPMGPEPGIAKERQEGRVGDLYRFPPENR
ncbi:MAG: NADP-dependent phosphogluconate dehydrogenase [Alphaproteobacteria bacterium]|jgi:6-phosphogluconate dehydrogenase|nr:NADP-dependent phosphogluconate dehydrogenase [Alphaproteobacteria bacterium]